jgi:hypothetical protein
MGYGGNKGAVAISFSLFRRRVVVLSSHFAAHQVHVVHSVMEWMNVHGLMCIDVQQQQQQQIA